MARPQPSRARASLLAALASLALAAPAARADTWIEEGTAVLQGLDKVTTRISTIEDNVGETKPFGTLEITVRACRKHPPEEPPEAVAFLEIREKKAEEAPRLLFSGWMFASSPALSALEHPVYDLWVVDCKNPKSDSSGKSG